MWSHVQSQEVQVPPAPDRILRLCIFQRRDQAITQQSGGSPANGSLKKRIRSEVPVGYGTVLITLHPQFLRTDRNPAQTHSQRRSMEMVLNRAVSFR